jgi:hypothetical protein
MDDGGMRYFMSKLVRTQILLDKKQRIELEEIANRERLSVSELVRNLLDAQLHLRKYEKMSQAAKELLADYQNGGDLTDFSSLPGDDFLE